MRFSAPCFQRRVSIDHVCSRVTDEEAVAMSRYLVLNDGLFIGSSSAVNLVACVKLAKQLPKGGMIATILCDSGSRRASLNTCFLLRRVPLMPL